MSGTLSWANIDCPEAFNRWGRDHLAQPNGAEALSKRQAQLTRFVQLMVETRKKRQSVGHFQLTPMTPEGVHRFNEMRTERSVTPESLDQYYGTVIKKGLIFDGSERPYDTSTGVAWTEERSPTAIYVMDAAGKIFSSTYRKHLVFHHSSFLSGASVAGAGEWAVAEGKLLMISNQSGHYLPQDYIFAQTVLRLFDAGIDLTGVILRHHANSDYEPTHFKLTAGDLDPLR